MKNYIVTVTGTWSIDVEAESHSQAEHFASNAIGDNRVGIWDMDLKFESFKEGDE